MRTEPNHVFIPAGSTTEAESDSRLAESCQPQKESRTEAQVARTAQIDLPVLKRVYTPSEWYKAMEKEG